MPDVVGYAAWLLLLLVWIWFALGRARGGRDASSVARIVRSPAREWRVVAVVCVLIVAFGIGAGVTSVKRVARLVEPVDAGRYGGSLACFDGAVGEKISSIPAGRVVLSDPLSSYRVMALGSVYVVADFKVWTAATPENKTVERLVLVDRFFDPSASDEERLNVIDVSGAQYVLIEHPRPGHQRRPMSESETDYDSRLVESLIARNPDRFELVASDRDSEPPRNAQAYGLACTGYSLWRVV
jgi:hypothetical protein